MYAPGSEQQVLFAFGHDDFGNMLDNAGLAWTISFPNGQTFDSGSASSTRRSTSRSCPERDSLGAVPGNDAPAAASRSVSA